MRKIIKTAALLLLVPVVASLFSCGGNMTEEKAKEILDELLPLSYEFNDIFWGEGLPVKDNQSEDRYRKVESEKYNSVDEILEAASKVFASEYLGQIKNSSVFSNDDELGIPARYIMVNGVLRENVTEHPYIKNFSNINGKIDTGSVKIKKQNSHTALLELSYTDGGTTEITLVLENGKWLINSATY